jgi:hypothetical protein
MFQSSTDILYHITNHTLWEASIVRGQQFTSLAGNFYRLSLERKDGEKQVRLSLDKRLNFKVFV